MKKLFMVLYPDEVLRIGTLTSLVAFTFSSFSQTIVDSTGFYGYAGTLASAPAGWYMSWHSTSAPSYYTVATSVGIAPPSYKFGQDSVFVITPQFAQADTVAFWCKGFNISDSSKLNLYASSDSVNWTLFASRDTLPTSGTVLKYGIPYGAKWLLFVYRKVSGNLAFDDVQIIDYPNISIICNLPSISVCMGDSVCFSGCSVTSTSSIAGYLWNFGDGNYDSILNPCHLYAASGTYTATLTAWTINGDSASVSIPVTILDNPVAGFITNINGGTVSCVDTSTSLSGSIVSWFWNFFPGSSTLQNPVITYSANGTYTICLTVTTTYGCIDTICQSISLTSVGINELNNLSNISVLPTISTNGEFQVKSQKSKVKSVEIYNTVGEEIRGWNSGIVDSENQSTIDLSSVPSGIYFLKLKTDLETVTKKIVIAH